jgi:hypothetical protein
MKRYQGYLLALALLLITALVAAAPSQRQTDWTRAAIGRLPIFHEDRGAEGKTDQLDAVAAAVAKASFGHPRAPREWGALLLTIGYHESTFSLRIHRGECNLKKRECDAGRARSGWQMHKNLFTAPLWEELQGLEHTEIQARAASDALERAYWTCAKSGVPWLQATINGYAGKRCGDTSWPGLQQRMATFNMLSHTATPAGGAS